MIFITQTLGLTCQTFYPICNLTFSTPEIIYPLPSFPCKSKCFKALEVCEEYINKNKEIFEKGNRIFLDCNIKDNGVDRWPESYAVYPGITILK